MSPYRVELQEWLGEVFPTGFRDTDFDISRILTGLEEHMPREMKDARIPMNWTETELQWDSICNALFDHAAQTKNEGLAWMLVKMVADRIHGQWRIDGNGGRVSALSDVRARERWLFAIKARLGVVDGWLRQNGGSLYSKYIFEALSNAVLLTVSPKRRLWNLDPTEDVSMFYERLSEILNLPVSGEWLQSVETLIQAPLLSDAGAEKVNVLLDCISMASKRDQKRWKDSDPVAMQTILKHVQRQTFCAHTINLCLRSG